MKIFIDNVYKVVKFEEGQMDIMDLIDLIRDLEELVDSAGEHGQQRVLVSVGMP